MSMEAPEEPGHQQPGHPRKVLISREKYVTSHQTMDSTHLSTEDFQLLHRSPVLLNDIRVCGEQGVAGSGGKRQAGRWISAVGPYVAW